MFGRIGRLLLAAFVSQAGAVLIEAGRGWVERKLNPPPAPTPEAPAVLPASSEEEAG